MNKDKLSIKAKTLTNKEETYWQTEKERMHKNLYQSRYIQINTRKTDGKSVINPNYKL